MSPRRFLIPGARGGATAESHGRAVMAGMLLRFPEGMRRVLMWSVVFGAGWVVGSVNESGWPSSVTVVDKSRGPACETSAQIAFVDRWGRIYREQLVSDEAWSTVRVGDELPARQRVGGELVSYWVHPGEQAR